MTDRGYEKVRELIDCEIDKIASKPELTKESLAALDVLVDVLKDLDEIDKEEYEGYSQRSYARNSRGGGRSYNRSMYGDGGYSGRGSYNRGYSRHDQKENIINQMEMLMDEASPQLRDAIYSIIDQMMKL